MTDTSPIRCVGVPAISFCQVPELIAQLERTVPVCKLNSELIPLHQNEDALIQFLTGCDAAIVSQEPVNDRVLTALPELRVISNLGVGLENIDPVAMQHHQVALGWRPGVNKTSVAELAVCLAIAALRHVVSTNMQMRAALRPLARIGRQLSGRVVGVHGCGNIGREFIRLLQPFECTILGCDLDPPRTFFEQYGVEEVDCRTLWKESELLSIHLALTPLTRGMYDAQVLQSIRPGCVLINTARGQIVDEFALESCLRTRRIAAAAFDVFAREPCDNDSLLQLENFIGTPHLGSGAIEARMAMGLAAIDGLKDHFTPIPGEFPF